MGLNQLLVFITSRDRRRTRWKGWGPSEEKESTTHQFSQENKLFEWPSGIESPHALLKEQRKGGFGNTIELPQMPFGLVPKVLYAIDLQALGIESFMVMVDCFVLVSLHG